MSIDKSKYLVLDLETNGTDANDDILSISVYKPDDGKLYNKFLPLERQKKLYATNINGITIADLKDAKALTQQDVDEIIEEFDVKNRIILTYSNFDKRMLKNYFQRKALRGFQHFNFYNFKHNIISSRFSEGNITKDNLCNLYGIEGVSSIHTSANDCILEWKLFEKMNGNHLLVTNNKVFEMSDNYIIPASYFYGYPNLKYYISDYPQVNMDYELVKRFEIPGTGIAKFETNINGMLIEHLINSMLKVEEMYSYDFCLQNKSKLTYIGTLPSNIHTILLEFKEDGTVNNINKEDRIAAKEFNSLLGILKPQFKPIIEYISTNIFNGQQIISHELMVHKQKNVLALCDLSSEDVVLEIKTSANKSLYDYKEQLYFEANGRECYLLRIDWDSMPKKLAIEIYRVYLSLGEAPESHRSLSRRLNQLQDKISDKNIEVISYFDTKSKVTLKCKLCENEWETSYYLASHEPKCSFCEPKLKAIKTRKQPLTEEEKHNLRASQYMCKILQKSDRAIIARNYTGAKNPVDAECLICGHKWTTRADHLSDRLFCSRCKANK